MNVTLKLESTKRQESRQLRPPQQILSFLFYKHKEIQGNVSNNTQSSSVSSLVNSAAGAVS